MVAREETSGFAACGVHACAAELPAPADRVRITTHACACTGSYGTHACTHTHTHTHAHTHTHTHSHSQSHTHTHTQHAHVRAHARTRAGDDGGVCGTKHRAGPAPTQGEGDACRKSESGFAASRSQGCYPRAPLCRPPIHPTHIRIDTKLQCRWSPAVFVLRMDMCASGRNGARVVVRGQVGGSGWFKAVALGR